MSKIFPKIFKKSLRSPKSQVKNTFIFKDVIPKTKILIDQIMILPHVTFLLTNVPIDLVKNSIEKRWNLIKSATNLPLQEFQKGIEFLIKILFFSLILRKLFKKKLSFRIHLYYRYVDDTFLIIPKNMIKETIENFNSYHTRLKLTGHGGTHRSVYDTASPGDRSVSTWPA